MLPSRIPAFDPSSPHNRDQAESSNRQQSPSASSAHRIALHWLLDPQQPQAALQLTWQPNIRTTLPLNPLEQRHQTLQATLNDWVNSLPPSEKSAGQALKKTLLNKKPHQKTLLIAFETSSLPDFFPHFQDLDHLQLSCKTKTIPTSIGKLNNLKVLTITAPELTELPSTLEQLNNLKSLLLRQCSNLSSLPSGVSRLDKLTELEIDQTSRENPLPDNTHLIPNLKKLSITCAPSIGNTFEQLSFNKKLQTLSLSNVPLHSQDLQTMPALADLKTLEISTNNSLTEIPIEFIQAHPTLTRLSIRYCSNFEGLPASINILKQLKTLDVLHSATLHTVPETIGQLKKLRTLSLHGCRALRALPRSLTDLHTSCTVHLEETGLSLNILEPLSRHVGGPQIRYSLPPVHLRNIGTLEEEAQKWFKQAMPPRPLSALELNHIAQLDPDSRAAMATLLARFRKTAQYQHQKHPTTQRICSALTTLLNKLQMLQRFCNMADESNRTCDDRTALGLIEMELAVLESRLMDKTAMLSMPQAFGGVVNVGLAIFKQRKLMDIAHEHAKRCKGAVDETEIVLKYITHLGPVLGLPVVLNNMLYEEHAWQVTQKDLNKAKATIEQAAQKNSTEFKAFLQKWYPFEVVLKQHAPKDLDHIETECYKKDKTLLVEIESARKALGQLKRAYTEHIRNTLAPETPNLEAVIQTEVENTAEVLDATATLNSFKQQREEAHASIWRPTIDQAISFSLNKRPANTSPNDMPESSKKPRVDGPL